MKFFSIKHTCIRCGDTLELFKNYDEEYCQGYVDKQKIEWRISFSKLMYHHYINHSLIKEAEGDV